MDLILFVAIAAGAVFGAARLLERRRENARILETYGPHVHPLTRAALARQGAQGILEQDGLWIKEHERELAERFRGQWIAVVRREVVAIGSTADEAWKAAASGRPGQTAFVRRIA
jgi:hypothetical protein